MKDKITYPFLLLIVSLLISSCKSHEELIYFQNLNGYPDPAIYEVKNMPRIKIEKGDILGINVYSFDPRAAVPFNIQNTTEEGGSNQSSGTQYLVDEEGTINFPVLGKIKVVDLTQTEVEGAITRRLQDGFIKEPVVDVRLLNFKVIVLGEAGNGILEVPNNRLNIIEAIALAGDISIYGDRKNVLVIREQQGKREFARVDITDAGIFNSPYYHLQNNDIIYLQPDRYKTNELNTNRVLQTFSIGTTLVSLITLLVTIVR